MTRDDILRMAREVGAYYAAIDEATGQEFLTLPEQAFERFAALVAESERKACAKVVESYTGAWDDQGYALAQAIRNRGKK